MRRIHMIEPNSPPIKTYAAGSKKLMDINEYIVELDSAPDMRMTRAHLNPSRDGTRHTSHQFLEGKCNHTCNASQRWKPAPVENSIREGRVSPVKRPGLRLTDVSDRVMGTSTHVVVNYPDL